MKAKHTLLFILIAIASFIPTAAQGRLFPTLVSSQGVESVYVSKAILSSIGANSLKLGKSGLEGDILKKIESVEIISTSTKSAAAKARKEASEIVSKMNLEVLTDVQDSSDTMTIYGDVSSDSIINVLLLVTSERNECNIIAIRGSIPLSALSQIANNM